jgi:outer membrane receptor protein involved in Fe transport
MRFIILIFLLQILNHSFSQERPNFQNIDCEVLGKVLDDVSKKPMQYANVTLFRMKDSTLAGGTITDEKGYFKLEKLRPGFYKIKIDFIGYERYTNTIKLTPQSPSQNIGIILLKPSVTQLSEVQVTSEKPQIEYQLDKKVINVDKNIVNSGGNAIDVLRNTPSIEVDMDGNVLLRGSSNVTILIDGKPSTFNSENKSLILEQIPASEIEKIEIITNPSAKYDPEGMAGILNIITKKEKRQGINGILSLNYGTLKKYGLNVGVNRRINKLNTFFNYDIRYDDRKGYRNHDRWFYNSDTLLYYTIIRSYRNNNNKSQNFKAGIDYNLSNNQTITLSTNFRIGERIGNDSSNNKVINYNSQYKQLYNRYEKSANPNKNIDISMNYRKRFDVPSKELTVDAYFSSGNFNDDENYTQSNTIPAVITPDQKSIRNNKLRNITIQSDYTQTLGEKTKIDAGFKTMIRTTDENYNFYNFDTLSNDFINDNNQSNRFLYTDQVYALYSLFSHEWNKISAQVGLRAEETFQHGDQKTTGYKFRKDYFNLFPSFHVSYNLSNGNKLQTSYSRRINRPEPFSLNPFIDKSNPLTWHSGNPDLKPEYINSYEISYLKDWKKISINTDLFYKWTDQVINRYRKIDTSGIVTVYPLNIDKAESYGVEFNVSSNPVKILRVIASFSYYKTSVIGSTSQNDLTNSVYSYNSKLNAFLMLPKNLSIQVNSVFNGPSVMAQATRTAFYTVDAGLKKEFFDRKASLSIRLSDIFNTMKFKVKTDDPSMKAIMEFKRETRILYITFTYKINEGVKQKERLKEEMNQMEMDFGE